MASQDGQGVVRTRVLENGHCILSRGGSLRQWSCHTLRLQERSQQVRRGDVGALGGVGVEHRRVPFAGRDLPPRPLHS